jgi:hypothetical protein
LVAAYHLTRFDRREKLSGRMDEMLSQEVFLVGSHSIVWKYLKKGRKERWKDEKWPIWLDGPSLLSYYTGVLKE